MHAQSLLIAHRRRSLPADAHTHILHAHKHQINWNCINHVSPYCHDYTVKILWFIALLWFRIKNKSFHHLIFFFLFFVVKWSLLHCVCAVFFSLSCFLLTTITMWLWLMRMVIKWRWNVATAAVAAATTTTITEWPRVKCQQCGTGYYRILYTNACLSPMSMNAWPYTFTSFSLHSWKPAVWRERPSALFAQSRTNR